MRSEEQSNNYFYDPLEESWFIKMKSWFIKHKIFFKFMGIGLIIFAIVWIIILVSRALIKFING